MSSKVRKSWDLGLNYVETLNSLVKMFNKYRTRYKKWRKRLMYIIVLLIQLRNGSRVGEAVEFLKQVCLNFRREDYIAVEKSKGKRVRKMFLPEIVTKNDIEKIKELFLKEYFNHGRKGFVVQISKWTRKTLGINTHSLRYAFITYMSLVRKESPQVIAKITGHKNIHFIVDYLEQVEAEKKLKQLSEVFEETTPF